MRTVGRSGVGSVIVEIPLHWFRKKGLMTRAEAEYTLPMRPIRLLTLLLVFALGACAQGPELNPLPATSTPKVTTLVEVLPESARCRVEGSKQSRSGRPAPLVFQPQELGYPIRVICNAPDYAETTAVIQPPLGIGKAEKPDAILTNRLAGGALLTVLASDQDGPTRLTILMYRSHFPYAAERDAFYAGLRAQHDRFWMDMRARVTRACQTGEVSTAGGSSVTLPTVCRDGLANLGQQRADNLRSIEIQRRRATFF